MISLNPWTGIWLRFQFSEERSGVVKTAIDPVFSTELSFKSSDERWLYVDFILFFFNTALIIVTWAYSGGMFSNMSIICLTPVHSSFLEGRCVGKYGISCLKHFSNTPNAMYLQGSYKETCIALSKRRKSLWCCSGEDDHNEMKLLQYFFILFYFIFFPPACLPAALIINLVQL